MMNPVVHESRQNRTLLFLLPLCLLCVGCGGTYDSYVSGVVTLDGTPLTRGTITYNPLHPGPIAYGSINADGNYHLNTGREEGLPSGEYTVTVVAKEDAIPDQSGRGLPPQPGENITPLWYASKASSGLSFAVESGSNHIDLELTSEPPPDWQPPGKRRRGR